MEPSQIVILDSAKWSLLEDAAVLPGYGEFVVTVDRLLRDQQELAVRSDYAVRLAVVDDLDGIRPFLEIVPTLDVHFPRFTSGTGFSIARILRQRYRFAGTLIASGDIRVDQIEFLARCGFDRAVLAKKQLKSRADDRRIVFHQHYQADTSSDNRWIGGYR